MSEIKAEVDRELANLSYRLNALVQRIAFIEEAIRKVFIAQAAVSSDHHYGCDVAASTLGESAAKAIFSWGREFAEEIRAARDEGYKACDAERGRNHHDGAVDASTIGESAAKAIFYCGREFEDAINAARDEGYKACEADLVHFVRIDPKADPEGRDYTALARLAPKIEAGMHRGAAARTPRP